MVAKGRNRVNSTHDFTTHCEIDALRNSENSLGHFDFSGMTLLTTAEPCPLCWGAIMLCGISTVVMGQRSAPLGNRFGDHTIEKLIQMSKWDDRLEVGVATGYGVARGSNEFTVSCKSSTQSTWFWDLFKKGAN